MIAAIVRALITVAIHKLNRIFCGARNAASSSCSPKSEIIAAVDIEHGKYGCGKNSMKYRESLLK